MTGAGHEAEAEQDMGRRGVHRVDAEMMRQRSSAAFSWGVWVLWDTSRGVDVARRPMSRINVYPYGVRYKCQLKRLAFNCADPPPLYSSVSVVAPQEQNNARQARMAAALLEDATVAAPLSSMLEQARQLHAAVRNSHVCLFLAWHVCVHCSACAALLWWAPYMSGRA